MMTITMTTTMTIKYTVLYTAPQAGEYEFDWILFKSPTSNVHIFKIQELTWIYYIIIMFYCAAVNLEMFGPIKTE